MDESVTGSEWRRRGKHGNHARSVATLLCRKLTRMSNVEIGQGYGGVRGSRQGLGEEIYAD